MAKTLAELAALVEGAVINGDKDLTIEDIEHDSRKITQGALFVCMEGVHVDGHKFIPQAKEKGAVAIVTQRKLQPEEAEGLTVLQVPDLKKALQAVVPFFHDYPARSMRVIGITGTNGKTSISYMVRAMLRRMGCRVGLIGTIQIMIEDQVLPIHNTTPDVVDLQRTLAMMREANMDYVVMEVSSHALDQNRVAGIEFDTAVFTNLTQDHLDYHKTLENYKKAGNIQVLASGAQFDIKIGEGHLPLKLQITGIFNVYNVMAAVGAALAEGVPAPIIKSCMEEFASVPGRFELVRGGQDFAVIVDYAHTPDGLENILETARQIAKKRIITVFGCGGDRDNTKRPIMGRIAAKMSDYVVATSDNPRSEDPQRILDMVKAGVEEAIGSKPHEYIIDRRQAIFRSVELAEKDDIVIIAGKGHENYQILHDKTIHFDDKEVALEAIQSHKGE